MSGAHRSKQPARHLDSTQGGLKFLPPENHRTTRVATGCPRMGVHGPVLELSKALTGPSEFHSQSRGADMRCALGGDGRRSGAVFGLSRKLTKVLGGAGCVGFDGPESRAGGSPV